METRQMKQKKIYCFGNEYIEDDDIAKLLARKIQKYKNFTFVIAESPMEILKENEEIWILDIAKGITKTQILTNPKHLELASSLSCHDLDLGFYLKLLTETEKIKKVNIVALPYGANNLEKLEKEVKEKLTSL